MKDKYPSDVMGLILCGTPDASIPVSVDVFSAVDDFLKSCIRF